ncbi:MAG: hypothetical protein V4655_07860 [Bdellovibrionota bacterium]
MARTKELVENYLTRATEEVKSYVAGLSTEGQDKKALKHDPKWRKLNAETNRLKRQITFIDRRNAKGGSAEAK